MKNKPKFTSRKLARSMAKYRMRRTGVTRLFHAGQKKKGAQRYKSPFALHWREYVYARGVMR